MKLITVLGIPVLAMLFAGCGVTHVTATIPEKDHPNKILVVADQEIGYSPYMVGISIRENYKYSFAIAATKTIDSGYKYFSVVTPEQLVKQYQDRNVMNVEEAYTDCMEGDGSFHTTASLRWIEGDANCQSIVFMSKEMSGIRSGLHRAIKYTIEMHNEDRNDHLTFNAADVLKSEVVQDLNKEYFTAIEFVD